jgi:cyclase
MLDRRQLLTEIVAGFAGSMVLARRSSARQSDVVRVTDRLSLVTSGRTNVLALSTGDGLVLVDSGAPDLADPLMRSLRRLPSGDRVRTVFNTHWHLENTGANEVLRQGGAEVIAHANTRVWMATPTWVPTDDRYRPARPKMAHPTKTFYRDGSMDAGGERIEYGYLLEAHTDGDIYVYFRDENVLAVGDAVSPLRDPELDWFGGTSRKSPTRTPPS